MVLTSAVNLVNTAKRDFFYPGETLNGNINVTSDKDRKVKGVKLRISGKGNVRFTEREKKHHNSLGSHNHHSNHHHSNHHHHHSSTSEYHTVTYKNDETYLDHTLNVLGYDGAEWSIKSGNYNYPFQFVLPYGLPSSFAGEFGSIEYSLDIEIGQSWAFDHSSHTTFQVVNVVDLNVEPTAQVPVVVKACKTFGIIFQSGPLDVTLRIPRSGAIPGESIPFIVEVFNKSDKTVQESLSIYKEVEFFAQGKSKTQSESVAEILGETLQPGADHVWQNNTFMVPQTQPSTLGRCRIISISYKLVLEMKVSGIGFNLDASSPFVIGNIPFRNVPYQPIVPGQPVAPYQPMGLGQSIAPGQPVAPYQPMGLGQPNVLYPTIVPYQPNLPYPPNVSYQPIAPGLPTAPYQPTAPYHPTAPVQPQANFDPPPPYTEKTTPIHIQTRNAAPPYAENTAPPNETKVDKDGFELV
ncbi:arrestin domain-containing protein 3-like isoform X2 [Bradysia coprophila]|uniref:arrestin domain-containing protein 3-like isoform X2 n=1 Tax=Bradysia coprophila TaxID=38358 RepID=UPI00187DC662|nr:arrestin domain-containing protein 3-like isoform X2 [Bradysia coprophila]